MGCQLLVLEEDLSLQLQGGGEQRVIREITFKQEFAHQLDSEHRLQTQINRSSGLTTLKSKVFHQSTIRVVSKGGRDEVMRFLGIKHMTVSARIRTDHVHWSQKEVP